MTSQKKVKGFKTQFSETVQEQAAERALRKRLVAKGLSRKQIVKRKINRGFLSKAEQKFNKSTKETLLRRGLDKKAANQTLRQIKRGEGTMPKRRIRVAPTPPGHNHPWPERDPSGQTPPWGNGTKPRVPTKPGPLMPERDPSGRTFPSGTKTNPWKRRRQSGS